MDSHDEKSGVLKSSGEGVDVDTDVDNLKPDFVKKIESFDVHNLRPEDIEYMHQVIGEFFVNKYSVRPELAAEIPSHTRMLSNEEFRAKVLEKDSEAEDDLDDLTGFYNEKDDCIYINMDYYDSPVELFSTMTHEGLHFVSLRNDAGFGGYFAAPESLQEKEEMVYYARKGLISVAEGTTQMLAWDALEEMGFTDNMASGYLPEVMVMRAVYGALPENMEKQLYFNTPMEDLRMTIEETFAPEYRETIRTGGVSGVFCDCLANIGIVVENMEIALNDDDGDEAMALQDDIVSAIEFFKNERNKNGF